MGTARHGAGIFREVVNGTTIQEKRASINVGDVIVCARPIFESPTQISFKNVKAIVIEKYPHIMKVKEQNDKGYYLRDFWFVQYEDLIAALPNWGRRTWDGTQQ